MHRARVTLVTCVWQRRAVARAFWCWAAWLRQSWDRLGIALDCVAGASDPLDADLARAAGARVVSHPNAPLGAKFNAALQAARGSDGVLVMGSDDFFCARVAHAVADAVHRRASVGLQDLYFADLPTGRMKYWRGHRPGRRETEPAGCGTFHPRAVLDALDWTLWDATRHKGMDHSRFARLAAVDAMPALLNVRAVGGFAVDVKNGTNLWAYHRCGGGGTALTSADATALWAQLPRTVVEALPWPVAA